MENEYTEFEWLDPERVDAVKGPANGTPFLMLKSVEEEPALSEDGAVKYVSAAARRKYARSGVAMPNGDFPIPDEGHLRSAIGRLGNYKGDHAAAKRHIIKRARALGLTHLLPEDWHVTKMAVPSQEEVQGRMSGADVDGSLGQTRELDEDEAVHMDNQADAGKPPAKPYRQPRPDAHAGFGTTSPDKSASTAVSLSQTRGMAKADHRGMGDSTPPPDEAADTDEAERESRRQTEEEERAEDASHESPNLPASPTEKAADADSPGTRAWEDKDVALAEEALRLVREFRNRERAEVSADSRRKARKAVKSFRRAAALLSGLADGTTHQTATKEVEDMDEPTLAKLINETMDAREAAARKAAKKAAKRAEQTAAKAAKKAAKKAAAGTAAEKVGKSAPEAGRPALNQHADLEARRVLRGQDRRTGADGNVFKALEDRVEEVRKTGTSRELRAAAREVGIAKLAANLGGQIPDRDALARRANGIPTPLFRALPESDRLAYASQGRRSANRADINVV